MCDSCAAGATPSVCLDDFLILVAEDRAEFASSVLPFRAVGQVVTTMLTARQAYGAWQVQVGVCALNEKNPLIKVAAETVLEDPSPHNVAILLREISGTPWHLRILEVIGILAVVHAGTVFAMPADYGK